MEGRLAVSTARRGNVLIAWLEMSFLLLDPVVGGKVDFDLTICISIQSTMGIRKST